MTVTTDSPVAELQLRGALTSDLERSGYKTIGSLTMHTAAYLLDKMRFRSGDMAAITEALAKHGLEFAKPIGDWNRCGTCPTCQTCGNPRAVDARNVAVDHLGRAKHLGGEFGEGPCHGCDEYHRGLVADRARELTGRLV